MVECMFDKYVVESSILSKPSALISIYLNLGLY